MKRLLYIDNLRIFLISLVAIFKRFINDQNNTGKTLSSAAYTVYIIHPLVLVGMAILFRNMALTPLLKFILLAPIALISVFVIAILIKKLPFTRKIL